MLIQSENLLQNPAFKFIIPEKETLYANKNSPSLFAFRIQKIYTNFSLENKRVLTDFSYSRLEIKELTWRLPSTKIILSLSDLLKDKTPPLAY